MDTTKFDGEFTYEKAKESIEALVLICLMGHFTGYRPSNSDEETEDVMAAFDGIIDDFVNEILEETNEEELHEIMESDDNGMEIFKKELFDLMKRMETV